MPPRYFSLFDRFLVLVAAVAMISFVVMAILTRGTMVVDLFTRIVTNR